MSARTVKATTPIAMYTVAQHMLDNELPAPCTIDAPRILLGETSIIITIDSADATSWLDSMVVDDERSKPSEYMASLEHVTYDGRILAALGEVRVQVRTMRRSVPLRVVGAAS